MTSSPWPPSSSSFFGPPACVSSVSSELIQSSPLIFGQSSLGAPAWATPGPSEKIVAIDTRMVVRRSMHRRLVQHVRVVAGAVQIRDDVLGVLVAARLEHELDRRLAHVQVEPLAHVRDVDD